MLTEKYNYDYFDFPFVVRCDECGGHRDEEETIYLPAPWNSRVAIKGENILLCKECFSELCASEATKISHILSRTDLSGRSLLNLIRVMAVTGYDTESCHALMDFMDMTETNPAWDESSWEELFYHLWVIADHRSRHHRN